MSKDREIRDLFARHNVPLDRDDVWAVQGQPVVKHKALERLAATLEVRFTDPQILRAERDEAVILVSGYIGKPPASHTEWSIGEALIAREGQPGGNYKVSPKQASYVWAMAEKRAKDRVILKLAGLQGVYSEEEADDFKSRDPEPSNAAREPVADSRAIYVENSKRHARTFSDPQKLTEWFATERKYVWPDFGLTETDPEGQAIIEECRFQKKVLVERSALG